MDALLKYELEELNVVEGFSIQEQMEVVGENRFKIENIESAIWAFRKLRAIEEKEKEINESAKSEIQRFKDWQENELKQFSRSKEFFNFLLEEYYRKQRELDPSFKLSTPYGKVSSRKQQPKWNYEDDVVIESLKVNKLDKFIRTKEEVNKGELKKEVTVIEYESGYVCVYDGTILGEVRPYDEDGIEYVNVETGEVYDTQKDSFDIFDQVVIYDGKIINGIKVEPQPDSITIKVEV